MKKRILCAILTLIMLISLVPAGAVTASAAANAASESAITTLKKIEYYTKTCNGTKYGVVGYGLPCGGDHSKGLHTTNELEADKALRAEVKELDTAVNNFASKNGLSLSQGQHDALVVFSYDNGTAWMNGTGDYKSAVVSGVKGNAFLNAAINWNTSDNDNRRMIEANMYMNGQYSSSVSSNFKTVTFNLNGGSMNDSLTYYYDASLNASIEQKPTNGTQLFMGWYDGLKWITNLNADTPATITAAWQTKGDTNYNNIHTVEYSVSRTQMVDGVLYQYPSTTSTIKGYVTDSSVKVVRDYIDNDGNKWCKISNTGWFKVGKPQAGSVNNGSIDVIVTVTNTYVRSRKENNIYSAQNGTYYEGAKLRIIDVADSKYDTFTWGQVAKSETDDTPIGWVALFYTDYDSIINKQESQINNSTVVAKATVTVNGYVNVRSGAGLNYGIVGALAQNTTVDLYETKFVNGHEWGRCTNGWFCLDYAKVVRLVADTTSNTDSNVVSYAFTFKPAAELSAQTGPNSGVTINFTTDTPSNAIPKDKDIVFSNLTLGSDGKIWVKAYWMVDVNKDGKATTLRTAWIKFWDLHSYLVSADGMDTIKFNVAVDALSVRESAGTGAVREDRLSKGTEIWITDYDMYGETVWGYAYDTATKQFVGWVELSAANVTRVNAPAIPAAAVTTTPGATISGKIATVINTDSVNLRAHSAATYKKIGTLAGGTTVAVWEEDNGWYKIDSNKNGVYDYEGDGWASGRYLEIRDGVIENGTASDGTTGTTTSETGLGIVSNTYTGVNVRSNPGTGSALLGKILAGTTVEIYETTTHGASKWGRTDEGWVCMDYIQMIGDLPADILAGLTGGAGSSSTTVTSSIYTGSVKTASVNVLKKAEDGADVIRTLNVGDPITLHEIVVITTKEAVLSDESTSTGDEVITKYEERTANWARVNDGWIKAPEKYITLQPLNEVTYTVTGNDTLNVRATAGINGTLLEKQQLKKGDQVVITKLEIANDGTVWGYIEARGGWASLGYMTEGALTLNQIPSTDTNTNTNTGSGNGLDLNNTGNTGNAGTNGFVNNAGGYRYTGKVIRTNSLNVRATASQTANKTTTLSGGDALVIYETTISEGMAWGRCDAGWVYLYYVDLVPANNAVDAKVVYTEGTIAYTDANCSSVAGTYSRMSVVDIYEVVGKMAKTDLGWVNTDNLG